MNYSSNILGFTSSKESSFERLRSQQISVPVNRICRQGHSRVKPPQPSRIELAAFLFAGFFRSYYFIHEHVLSNSGASLQDKQSPFESDSNSDVVGVAPRIPGNVLTLTTRPLTIEKQRNCRFRFRDSRGQTKAPMHIAACGNARTACQRGLRATLYRSRDKGLRMFSISFSSLEYYG